MSQWDLHDERIYAVLLDTLQRTLNSEPVIWLSMAMPRTRRVSPDFDALPIREGDNPLANHVLLNCAVRLKIWAGT